MADTNNFFSEFLPNKVAGSTLSGVYQFNITGAGTWTADLDNKSVTQGEAEKAGCVITCGKDDWEKLLDNPSIAMQLFMTGKLTASNLGMATNLQKLLA